KRALRGGCLEQPAAPKTRSRWDSFKTFALLNGTQPPRCALVGPIAPRLIRYEMITLGFFLFAFTVAGKAQAVVITVDRRLGWILIRLRSGASRRDWPGAARS